MATITDLAFVDGDVVAVNVSPGVWDLAVVEDNELVIQLAGLNLNLQRGFNQYSPDAGWDLFKYLGADLSQVDIDEISRQVKQLTENLSFVVSAKCTYLGFVPVGRQSLHTFQVSAQTTFGTASIPYALGVAS